MIALTRKKALLVVAVTFAVILTVAGLLFYDSRAIISYSISGYAYSEHLLTFNRYGPIYTSTMPNTYYHMNSNTPLMVALHWDNMGKTDASLQIFIKAENANITWFSNFGSDNKTIPVWATESDGQVYNGTTATFTSLVHQSEMQYKYLNILPIGHPNNFTVTLTIKDSTNPLNTIAPNGTTTATYQLIKDDTYQLVS